MREDFDFDILHHGKDPMDSVYKEKKVKVPEGMLKEAEGAIEKLIPVVYRSAAEPYAKIGLEAALIWLSENPIVPTYRQFDELERIYDKPETEHKEAITAVLVEWQRRMFLAPEIPEIWMPFVRNAPKDAVSLTIHGVNGTVLAEIDLESYRKSK